MWVYCQMLKTSMAAFQWMHVSPVKQSDMSLPRKCDYQTEGTERSQCVAICVFQITQNRGWLVGFLNFNYFTLYAPGLKGPPGASSVWIVRPSVYPFVCNSVPLTNKVQHLKFGWSYSDCKFILGLLKLQWHHMPPWDGWGQNVALRDFTIFWLRCRRGHLCFTNTCLVKFLLMISCRMGLKSTFYHPWVTITPFLSKYWPL